MKDFLLSKRCWNAIKQINRKIEKNHKCRLLCFRASHIIVLQSIVGLKDNNVMNFITGLHRAKILL